MGFVTLTDHEKKNVRLVLLFSLSCSYVVQKRTSESLIFLGLQLCTFLLVSHVFPARSW